MFKKKKANYYYSGMIYTHDEIMTRINAKLQDSNEYADKLCKEHDDNIKQFADIITAENLKIVEENKDLKYKALKEQLRRLENICSDEHYVDICEYHEDWLDYNPKPLLKIPYCGSKEGLEWDSTCADYRITQSSLTGFDYVYREPKDRARKIIIDIEKEIKELECAKE